MPTLEERLSRSTDKITDILTKKQSGFGDLGSALLAHHGKVLMGQPASFGEELNAIKARRLGEEKTLYDVLSKERGAGFQKRELGQGDRRLDIREGELYAKLQKYGGEAGKREIAFLKSLGVSEKDMGWVVDEVEGSNVTSQKEIVPLVLDLEKAGRLDLGADVVVSTHPLTGAVSFADKSTKKITTPPGQSDLPKKVQSELTGQNVEIEKLLARLPDLQSAVEKGVGLVPAAKELGGKVLGQLPSGSVDVPGLGEIGTGEKAVNREVVQARTALRTFREDVISAYRTGRMPLQQQNRILEFVDKLGIIESAPDARLAFEQLEKELRGIRDQNEARLGSSNPYSDMSDQEVLELLKQQGYDIGQ